MGRLDDMKKAVANKPPTAPPKPPKEKAKPKPKAPPPEPPKPEKPKAVIPPDFPVRKDGVVQMDKDGTPKRQVVHACGHVVGLAHYEESPCKACRPKVLAARNQRRIANKAAKVAKLPRGRLPSGSVFTDAKFTDDPAPRWDATLLVPGFEPVHAHHSALEGVHRLLYTLWHAEAEKRFDAAATPPETMS